MKGGNADAINGIDIISNPSQAEILHKKVSQEKKGEDLQKKLKLYEQYGIQPESIKTLDPRLKLGQTEAYTEYSWDGRILNGTGKVTPKSKYDEDVYLHNHTSVWGSYYNRTRQSWGYACCHSLLKNAYCTGTEGRTANDAANNSNMDASQTRIMLENRANLTAKREKSNIHIKRSDLYGESTGAELAMLDEGKLLKAIQAQETTTTSSTTAAAGATYGSSTSISADEKTRAYNSMKTIDVGLEDMEAYRLKRQRKDDPMAAFLTGEGDE